MDIDKIFVEYINGEPCLKGIDTIPRNVEAKAKVNLGGHKAEFFFEKWDDGAKWMGRLASFAYISNSELVAEFFLV